MRSKNAISLRKMLLIRSTIIIQILYFCNGLSTIANSLSQQQQQPRKIQSLLDHLQLGDSKVSDNLSVVSTISLIGGEEECGIKFNGVTAKEENEIAFIDRSEFITTDSGLQTEIGQAVNQYLIHHEDEAMIYKELLSSIYLAIFLVSKRYGNNNNNLLFYSLYLETLPSLEALQHLPVFWSKFDLKELQGSSLKSAILQRRLDWADEYNMILSAIKEEEEAYTTKNNQKDHKYDFFDLNTWYWARSIVTSRAFHDTAIAGSECLIPYIDMLNHISISQGMTAAAQEGKEEETSDNNNDVIMCDWSIDTRGFHLKLPESYDDSKAAVDAMKNIEISYGTHSNSHFLINYGFSILDDAHQLLEERVNLPMNPCLVGSDTTKSEKDILNLWQADDLNNDDIRNVGISIGDPHPMESVLSLCRVASSQGNELTQMKELFIQKAETISQNEDELMPQLGATLCRKPFSFANEIRAMEMLREQTTKSLAQYDTTFDEDDELLFDGGSSILLNNNNKCNALILRRGEKCLLQHFYNLAFICLTFIEVHQQQDTATTMELYRDLLDELLNDQNSILQFD